MVRLDCSNGYRPRNLTTQVNDIDLQIPKLRQGGFLPSIHEPRRRVDRGSLRDDHGGLLQRRIHPQG